MSQEQIPASVIRSIMKGKGNPDEAGKYNFDLDPILDLTISEALDKGISTEGIENRLEYIKRHGGVLAPIYEKQLVVAEKSLSYNPEEVQEATPITSLPLPQHIVTELLQQGITTVGELRQQNGQALAQNPNVGHEGIGILRSAFIGTAFATVFNDDVKAFVGKGVRGIAKTVDKALKKHKRKKGHSSSTHDELDEEMSIDEALGEHHSDIAEKLHERGIHTLHHLLHAEHSALSHLTLSESRSVRTILDDFGLSLKSPFAPPTPFDERNA